MSAMLQSARTVYNVVTVFIAVLRFISLLAAPLAIYILFFIILMG